MVWLATDTSDGAHPNSAGVAKIASKMLDFFLTSPYSSPWFAA
jgi:lysophospholipase L1-like esterase